MTQRVVILSSPGPHNTGSNPFVRDLIAGLPPDCEVRAFTWLRAYLSPVDVIHIHWPEYLVRSRFAALRLARSFLLWLLPLWSRRRGVRVIRTVHNLDPHEDVTLVERQALDALDRRAAALVHLTPSRDGTTEDQTLTVIPHPHYGGSVDDDDLAGNAGTRQGLLFFGVVRPYKGIEELLTAFESTGRLTAPAAAGRPPTLTIVGQPWSAAYAEALEAAAPPDVTLDFRRLEDRELHRLIARAGLVVLPYRRMYNSGAVMLALTCGTPVLVPDSVSMRVLRRETGEDWVRVYSGSLDGRTLRDAYDSAMSTDRAPRPRLEGRDPRRISELYAALYRRHAAGGRVGR